jgi:hypothetical protein
LSCAICEERKEKRFCPAVHGKICPQCCGEQREVTLDCPSECPYLQQSRAHTASYNDQPPHFDREELFPDVEITEQFLYECEELIMGLSFALAKVARSERSLSGASLSGASLSLDSSSDRGLMDRDFIAAISSLAKKYRTLVNSSLVYEEATTSVSHQVIMREVETMIGEFRATEVQHAGQTRLRDSDVLKALVFILRMGLGRTSGRPKSRAFVDFLFTQFPERPSSVSQAGEAGSSIVIP